MKSGVSDRKPVAKGSSDRTFGLTMAAAFAVFALLPLLSKGTVHRWALIGSGSFVLPALLSPAVLAPLNRLWTRFGLLLHAVTSPLVLGVMYFLVITPLGLVFRAVRRDELRLRLDPAASSYWVHRHPPGPQPESLKRQF